MSENGPDRLVIVSPGGLTGGGGVGSVTREIHDWLTVHRPGMKVAVIDTWGSGSSRTWPFMLARSLLEMVMQRLQGSRLLHIQITEGGSLLRKGLVLRLGKVLGMRSVLHHHGAKLDEEWPGYSPRMRRWLIDTVRGADINIVLGERGRRFLVETLGVPDNGITTLPNAVADLSGIRSGQRDAGTAFHYLLMANLSPRKGVGEFLAALSMLRGEGREIKATLAGGGDVERYRQEAARLGLGDLCTFTGWVKREQVKALLAEADALVLPSFQEVLPMAILEALSAGLPVIATPVGSIPEVIVGGRQGLLVPPGDIEALAAAMRELMDDPALRRQLALSGRSRYEERFQIDIYMAGLLAVYARVATRPGV